MKFLFVSILYLEMFFSNSVFCLYNLIFFFQLNILYSLLLIVLRKLLMRYCSVHFILLKLTFLFYSEAPSANVISVQVGTKYFDRKGMHVNVVENIIHPNYSDKTLDCDIAILKLETNLQFGKSIKAIPLINSNETIEDGVMCNNYIFF